MAIKPTSKPDWVSNDDAAKIIEPSAGKKLSGFFKLEKPVFQVFNWVLNNISHWINTLAGNLKYNVIIDVVGAGAEADYNTIQAYLADSPAAGDRVLIKNSQTITATLSIPFGVTVETLPGVMFTVSGIFTPILTMSTGSSLLSKSEFSIDTTSGSITTILDALGSDILIDDIDVVDTAGVANTVTNFILVSGNDNVINGRVSAQVVTNNINDTGSGNAVSVVKIAPGSPTPADLFINEKIVLPQMLFSLHDANQTPLSRFIENRYIPTLTGSVSGSFTLDTGSNFHKLSYNRVGTTVTVFGFIRITVDNAASGDLTLSLPVAGGGGIVGDVLGVGFAYFIGHGGTIAGQTGMDVIEGSTSAEFFKVSDAGVKTILTDADVDGAFDIYINLTYQTAT